MTRKYLHNLQLVSEQNTNKLVYSCTFLQGLIHILHALFLGYIQILQTVAFIPCILTFGAFYFYSGKKSDKKVIIAKNHSNKYFTYLQGYRNKN